MDSPSILDLERLSLAELHTLHPLPSPDSSPAPTLHSLPPELLTQIFGMTQLHLSPSKRNTNLASLCRVNHHFLGIARPLLYHEIHLDPSLHRNKTFSNYSKLINTLLFAPTCASFVRSIKITLKADAGDMDCIVFRSLLRRCKRLERVSTGWEEWKAPEAIGAQVIEAISKEAKLIKHLEVPRVRLNRSLATQLVQALWRLETLVFNPVSLSDQIFPLFSLRKVVWGSRMVNRALGTYLSSSRYTLTSISFQFEYAEPPMLDILPNLSTLRLTLGSFRSRSHSRLSSVSTDYTQSIQTVLLSTHSLPLKHLTISTTVPETARALANYSILEHLPSTILSFTTVPQLLGCLNLPSLLPNSNDTSSYSCLRLLTIIPPLFAHTVDDETYRRMEAASRQVSKVFEEKKIEIIVELGAKLGDRYGIKQVCGI